MARQVLHHAPDFADAGDEVAASTYLDARPPLRRLRQCTVIPLAPAEVFPFFADARNLEGLTPSWLRFEILTPSPIEMREGAIIDYRIRLGPLPTAWRTRIEAWEPPFRFVDSQLSGPYRCWWHEHRFEDLGGSTRMSDEVLFTPALGRLGQAFAGARVERRLERIFKYRATAIERHFGVSLSSVTS